MSWLSSPKLTSASIGVGARREQVAATKKGSSKLVKDANGGAPVCRDAESMGLTPLVGDTATVNLEPECKLVAQSATQPCYSDFAVAL